MARHEQLSVGELQVDNLISGGDVFRRKIYLDPTNGSDGNDGVAIDRPVKTLDFGLDKLTTGRKDGILMVPGTSGLSLSADPDWNYNLLSLIGIGPEARMNHRARIGMSTTFTPFFTVSGYGNLFQNFYTMHGTAAGDRTGPDLGALDVDEERHGDAGRPARFAQPSREGLVFLLAAVGHVEPGDVHPGREQGVQHRHRRGGGAEGADDLGLPRGHGASSSRAWRARERHRSRRPSSGSSFHRSSRNRRAAPAVAAIPVVALRA